MRIRVTVGEMRLEGAEKKISSGRRWLDRDVVFRIFFYSSVCGAWPAQRSTKRQRFISPTRSCHYICMDGRFIVGFKGLEAVFGRPVDAVGKSPPPPPQQQQKQQQQQFSRAGEVWAFSSFRHAGYSVRWLLSLTFPNQPISNRAQERWGLEVTHF